MDYRNNGQASAMSDERMSGSDSFTTTSETYSDDESCHKKPRVCDLTVLNLFVILMV